MPAAHDLRTLHQDLQRRYGEILSRRLMVASAKSGNQDLQRLQPGGKALFELVPADRITNKAVSKRGSRRYVFPLSPSSSGMATTPPPGGWRR